MILGVLFLPYHGQFILLDEVSLLGHLNEMATWYFDSYDISTGTLQCLNVYNT